MFSHPVPSKPSRAKFRIRREFPQTNKDSSSQADNSKMEGHSQIITSAESPSSISYSGCEETPQLPHPPPLPTEGNRRGKGKSRGGEKNRKEKNGGNDSNDSNGKDRNRGGENNYKNKKWDCAKKEKDLKDNSYKEGWSKTESISKGNKWGDSKNKEKLKDWRRARWKERRLKREAVKCRIWSERNFMRCWRKREFEMRSSEYWRTKKYNLWKYWGGVQTKCSIRLEFRSDKSSNSKK